MLQRLYEEGDVQGKMVAHWTCGAEVQKQLCSRQAK